MRHSSKPGLESVLLEIVLKEYSSFLRKFGIIYSKNEEAKLSLVFKLLKDHGIRLDQATITGMLLAPLLSKLSNKGCLILGVRFNTSNMKFTPYFQIIARRFGASIARLVLAILIMLRFSSNLEIIIDRNIVYKPEKLAAALLQIGIKSKITLEDSYKSPRLQVADFIAGACRIFAYKNCFAYAKSSTLFLFL